MAIELSPLPYAKRALEPHISERTLEFHHGKHHQGYVNKVNKAIEGTKLDDANLEEIIAAADGDDQGLFNNAAQVWNHSFYWNSMSPNGGGAPSGDIACAIDDTFGGYDSFREAFVGAGAGRFGSGWAWLIARDGKLDVINTLNADTPLTDKSATPLLTMDVWEHAYYLDYQNGRGTYIDAFLYNLVNWNFVNANLKAA